MTAVFLDETNSSREGERTLYFGDTVTELQQASLLLRRVPYEVLRAVRQRICHQAILLKKLNSAL